ncbi:uncharacterized protein LOC143233306 [Tachypleus tridentatus]|uniref:uncharacterized protein LOC143233306 n=1 Tax=Tachypleus tridentatus TaxID=6853 RepID=UPI003FD46005
MTFSIPLELAQTVSNRLHEECLRSRWPARGVILTTRNRAARLEFGRQHLDWELRQWVTMLWTDESRFTVFREDGRARVWRRQGFSTRNFVQVDAYGDSSVMVWAGICLAGRTDLLILDKSALNTRRYRDEILEPIVRPFPGAVDNGFTLKQVSLTRPLNLYYHDDDITTWYNQSEFVTVSLRWHNNFRGFHGSPPLLLSSQLCVRAQDWANHLAHTNTIYHRNDMGIGQNLFCKCLGISDADPTGDQVAKYWYQEIKMYDFYQKPSLLHVKSSHFTQMVWRNTQEFGIGKTRTRFGKIVVVANYRPAGNVIGYFHQNVFPPVKNMEES